MQLETARHIVWTNRRHLQSSHSLHLLYLLYLTFCFYYDDWISHLFSVCPVAPLKWAPKIQAHLLTNEALPEPFHYLPHGSRIRFSVSFGEHEMDKEPRIMHNRIAPYWFLKTNKLFQSHCHPNMLVEKIFHTARGSCLGAAGLIQYSWYSTISTIFY